MLSCTGSREIRDTAKGDIYCLSLDRLLGGNLRRELSGRCGGCALTLGCLSAV